MRLCDYKTNTIWNRDFSVNGLSIYGLLIYEMRILSYFCDTNK